MVRESTCCDSVVHQSLDANDTYLGFLLDRDCRDTFFPRDTVRDRDGVRTLSRELVRLRAGGSSALLTITC